MANMIQGKALKERKEKDKNEDEEAKTEKKEHSLLRLLFTKQEQRAKGKKKGSEQPELVLVPTTIEEAPMRRQDRRTLNAVSKRKGDRNMMVCLFFTIVVMISLGIESIVVWYFYRAENNKFGTFMISGIVVIVSSFLLLLSFGEIANRYRKMKARVLDKDLFSLKNLHEVKHWIEPNLVGFGWGNYDWEEEARTLDEKRLRIPKKKSSA